MPQGRLSGSGCRTQTGQSSSNRSRNTSVPSCRRLPECSVAQAPPPASAEQVQVAVGCQDWWWVRAEELAPYPLPGASGPIVVMR